MIFSAEKQIECNVARPASPSYSETAILPQSMFHPQRIADATIVDATIAKANSSQTSTVEPTAFRQGLTPAANTPA